MKSYRKELWFNIPSRRGFVNITPEVETAIRESGIREGFVLVNASLSHLHHQNRPHPIAKLSEVCGFLR